MSGPVPMCCWRSATPAKKAGQAWTRPPWMRLHLGGRSSRPRGDRGTGLGLANRVRHHQAKWRACGRLQREARSRDQPFKVYLPRVGETANCEQGATRRPGDAARQRDGAAGGGRGRSPRLDTPGAARTVATPYWRPATADEAARIARQHPERIDLVVTDVIMHADGRPRGGLTTGHPASGGESPVPVRLQVDDERGVVRHGILEAEVAFLQKPNSPPVLAVKVRQVLDRRLRGGAAQLPSAPVLGGEEKSGKMRG